MMEWLWVVGYWFWVRLVLTLEKTSISQALSTHNPQPNTKCFCLSLWYHQQKRTCVLPPIGLCCSYRGSFFVLTICGLEVLLFGCLVVWVFSCLVVWWCGGVVDSIRLICGTANKTTKQQNHQMIILSYCRTFICRYVTFSKSI